MVVTSNSVLIGAGELASAVVPGLLQPDIIVTAPNASTDMAQIARRLAVMPAA